MKPVRLSEPARQDKAEAAVWYAQQCLGLEEDFLQEVEAILAQIAEQHDIFPFAHGELRRALVRRLPYAVIFFEENSTIIVIAVMLTSRDPEAWRSRR
jgi:plasmid stabilization system protein ParE